MANVGRVEGRSIGLVVLLCLLVAALEGYDIQAFGVASPRLVAELGLSSGQQGWAGSGAMFGLVVGALFGGWIADHVGRRPVLVASVVAFGAFSLLTAMSQDYASLLFARFATGIGFGGAMPNLIAIATEISSPKRRAATVTTMFCGMPAGGAAVALLARIAGEGLDWRTIFLIGGVLPLLLAPAIHFLLPETRPGVSPGADRKLLSTLFGEGRTLGTLLLWLVFILTLMVLYLMLNWLPTLVIDKGLTPADGSSASLSFNLASIVGALALGFLVDRAGFRWPVTLAYVGLAAAMYALASATGLGAVLALSGLAGFLLLGAQYASYALAPVLYPPHVRGAGAGAAVAVGRLGSIFGPLVAGELRQAGYDAGQVFAVMVPVVLAAGAAVLALSLIGKPRED